LGTDCPCGLGISHNAAVSSKTNSSLNPFVSPCHDNVLPDPLGAPPAYDIPVHGDCSFLGEFACVAILCMYNRGPRVRDGYAHRLVSRGPAAKPFMRQLVRASTFLVPKEEHTGAQQLKFKHVACLPIGISGVFFCILFLHHLPLHRPPILPPMPECRMNICQCAPCNSKLPLRARVKTANPGLDQLRKCTEWHS